MSHSSSLNVWDPIVLCIVRTHHYNMYIIVLYTHCRPITCSTKRRPAAEPTPAEYQTRIPHIFGLFYRFWRIFSIRSFYYNAVCRHRHSHFFLSGTKKVLKILNKRLFKKIKPIFPFYQCVYIYINKNIK